MEIATDLSNHAWVYRADIDGMRALAIAAVVAFHIGVPYCTGGFVGVDVFLVISGYLIGSLVYREVLDGRFSIARFYERRARRILPAFLVVLAFCYITALLLLSPLELRRFCASAIAAVSSTSNIYYWLKSGYFNSGAELKPLLMTWSLGIEEQFYLFFPVVLLAIHRWFTHRVRTWMVVGIALSFACCVFWLRRDLTGSFFLLPFRGWELGMGTLIAADERRDPVFREIGAGITNILGWIGLTLVIVSIATFGPGTRFPGFAALLPTIGTVCLIKAKDSFVNRKLFSLRPIVFVGLVSYSWYLWHWPLLSFARITTSGSLPSRAAGCIAVLSFVLAVASYYFVEQPFRKSTVPTGMLLMRYSAVVFVFLLAPSIGLAYKGFPARWPELSRMDAEIYRTETNPCLAHDGVAAPRLTAPCVTGSGTRRIAIMGDSHAAALTPALTRYATARGYGVEILTKAGCPQLSAVARRSSVRPGFDTECAAYNRAALTYVLQDESVELVVLAGFWSAPVVDGGKEDGWVDTTSLHKTDRVADSWDNLGAGLAKTIGLLQSAKKRVIVATDIPRFSFSPPDALRNSLIARRKQLGRMLGAPPLNFDGVDEVTLLNGADRTADEVVKDAAVRTGADVIDLRAGLCPYRTCDYWRNGSLLYIDRHHLTAAGAEVAIGSRLAEAWR